MRPLAAVIACVLSGCSLYFDTSQHDDDNDAGSPDASTPDGGLTGLLPVAPLAPLPVGWSLSLARQIGSPAPDSTGVTFDGTQLWLITGGHNADTHRLVRYDDVNYVVTCEYTFHNLIEELGTGVYGIAWDGHYIWISVSGNRNKLVAVDPNTGAIVRTWGSPTILGPSSLSFDGTSMWLGDGTGTIFKMNLTTGAVISSFPTSPAFIRDNGIASRTDQVLVNGLFYEGLALFAADGTLIGRDPYSVLGPMTFTPTQLVAVDGNQIYYFDIH